MELKDLVGNKKLDAVELQSMEGFYGNYNLIKFRLDGIVYCAMEDEEDGYRSSMKYITVLDSDNVKNIFTPIDVICTYDDRYNSDLLGIYDAETRELVLEVGTNNDDEYYPSFVAHFSPEAMITNKKENKRGTEKKWKVTFTVSGIKDSDYDEIISSIENFIDEKYLDVDIGIGEEIE